MQEAMLYERLAGGKIRCNVCAHRCVIRNNSIGVCGIRQNLNGTLYALNYGKLIAQYVDPIEKKPLYHFYPNSTAYSIATVGCNFKCAYCQNADISQMPMRTHRIIGRTVAPEQVVERAIRYGCKSIAYTYTEPAIFYEYALDVSRLAHENDLKNVFVTNGYLTPEALEGISPYLDAANVDLKSFSKEFYKKICRARLQSVLDTLQLLKQLGIWVEVTTLIIPTLNDAKEELRSIAEFIAGLGQETPWHPSAYYPAFELAHLPPTPPATLFRAREIGLSAGLRYVYTGNIGDDKTETTYCHNCGKSLMWRSNYQVTENHLVDARCPFCGAGIDGVGLQNGNFAVHNNYSVYGRLIP